MQLRWIAIGMVCFSAALLSACGGAPSNALSDRSSSAAMSKSAGRYDKSDKDKNKSDDDCDESEDHHDSSSRSSSMMSSKSSDDDKPECKDSDDDHGGSSSRSSSMYASKSTSKDDGKDHDKDDDDTCKVTICHIPPGNHCNPHTIRVGKSAERAHIEHGDYPGACDPGTAAPVADAGPAQSVPSATVPVTLDGSASKSPNGLALGFKWLQTGGPAVVLANAAAAKPNFAAPKVPAGNSPVALTFQLIVTDSNGVDSAPADVTITVTPEAAAPAPTCDPLACPGDPNGNGQAICNADGTCGLACFPGTVLDPAGGACVGLGG